MFAFCFFGMIIQFDSKYMFSHVRDSTYIAVLYKPKQTLQGESSKRL